MDKAKCWSCHLLLLYGVVGFAAVAHRCSVQNTVLLCQRLLICSCILPHVLCDLCAFIVSNLPLNDSSAENLDLQSHQALSGLRIRISHKMLLLIIWIKVRQYVESPPLPGGCLCAAPSSMLPGQLCSAYYLACSLELYVTGVWRHSSCFCLMRKCIYPWWRYFESICRKNYRLIHLLNCISNGCFQALSINILHAFSGN